MGKILLVGPAGCGKTHQLIESFEKALSLAADPLASDVCFVVPSAEHTERVVSVLIQRGLKGFFHKRVTTLSRLAQDLFRVADIPVASSLTRMMIVRDLLRDHAWTYFKDSSAYPGFAGLMAQFITELKESCISPEIFRERMNALKGFEPAYALKYEALADFYGQYEAQLAERGLRDTQDALRIFRERKKGRGASALRFRALWIDGFFDFSNLQLEVLKELAMVSGEVTVTLTREDPKSGAEGIFEPVARTQAALEAAGFITQWMSTPSKRTTKPALLFLQQHLFAPKEPRPAPVPGENLVMLDAVGNEGEIELIARQIHKLYATGGYRYSDFAVLFRQIRHYAPIIASVFSRYGIPTEIHERDRLKFSPWIAAVQQLLVLFREAWKPEALFAFLRSDYVRQLSPRLPKSADWIACFEQHAFREGIAGGREAWLADWTRGVPEELAVFNSEKTAALKVFAETEDRFRAATAVEEHIRIFRQAVYDSFGILEIRDTYSSLTRRDAASVHRFEVLLEEIRGYFSRHPGAVVSFESFADHFLGLVELDVYSLHERDKNRVQVYDVSLARQKEYKVVFVAGLLEKVFPQQVREDPLLSDWERQLVNGGLASPIAECLPRQNIERYLFYLAVTRAKERLFLSYPRVDFEGKESLPSFYLEEVKALFGDKLRWVRQDLAKPFPSPADAITHREMEASVVGGLRQEGDPDVPSEEALRQLSGDPKSRERLLTALEPVEAILRDEKILRGKYFETPETSPTRLETYAKCPYRYFADKILRLKDTGEDISMMQKGNILHHVLQQYFDPRRKPAPKEKLEIFIEREIEEGLKRHPLTWTEPYEEALDRRELFQMLFDFLNYETERLKRAVFRPCEVEYSFGTFGQKGEAALEIPGEDSQTIKLRGRVDRIDTDAEKKYAVVMDYKRSYRFKASSLAVGTALQLPLYLLAAQRHLGLQPLGAEIYSIRDHKKSGFYCAGPAGNYGKEFSSRSQLPDDVFHRVLERASVFVRKFTNAIRASEIPVRPRDCESFCPFDTVCRIEKWRLPLIQEAIASEDRKDPRLAPFQALAGGGEESLVK